MHECLVLSKAGVPWDVVMDMDSVMRRGMCIAAGTVEGQKFNWTSLRWEKPNG